MQGSVTLLSFAGYPRSGQTRASRQGRADPPRWCSPVQKAYLRLLQAPSFRLLAHKVMRPESGEVAFAGPPALVVRDRVILVAARCRIAAAGEPTGALADVDHVPQRRGRLVSLGLALMEALADREWPDRDGQAGMARQAGNPRQLAPGHRMAGL